MCGEFVPPFNIPTASENIAIFIILPFYDPGNLVAFNKMEQSGKLSIMSINFKDAYEILERTHQWSWKYFSNRSKLGPPTGKPNRQISIEKFIKIKKPRMSRVIILVEHKPEPSNDIIMIGIGDSRFW